MQSVPELDKRSITALHSPRLRVPETISTEGLLAILALLRTVALVLALVGTGTVTDTGARSAESQGIKQQAGEPFRTGAAAAHNAEAQLRLGPVTTIDRVQAFLLGPSGSGGEALGGCAAWTAALSLRRLGYLYPYCPAAPSCDGGSSVAGGCRGGGGHAGHGHGGVGSFRGWHISLLFYGVMV